MSKSQRPRTTSAKPEREISDESHQWMDAKRVPPMQPYEFCKVCLMVRRADRKNSRCRGPARLDLREQETPQPTDPRTIAANTFIKESK